MKKNTAGQLIAAQLIDSTDGTALTTGTTNVAVEVDGTPGTGGTATHVANGKWEFAPIQADTNGDHLTFQWTNATGPAIPVTQNVYTSFPQSVDNNVLAAGATGFAAIHADTDSLETKVPQTLNLTASGNIGIDWGNVENPTTAVDLSATDIQTVDVVTGHTPQTGDTFALANGASGFAATKAETALIVADTNELQTDWANGGRLDTILDSRMAEASINTTAGVVDVVNLVNTTTNNTDMASVPADVIAILADTNELQTDWANGGRLDTILDTAAAGGGASASAIADAVWTEILADHSGVSGSTAEALNAAGAAGDPWITALPGSYTTGQAGYLVGNGLAPISAIKINAGRTFNVKETSDGYESERDITLQPGFEGHLAFDFGDVLNPSTTLNSVTSVTDVTSPANSPAVVISEQTLRADKQAVHFKVTTLTDALTYRLKCIAVTNDGQTIPVIGILKARNDP